MSSSICKNVSNNKIIERIITVPSSTDGKKVNNGEVRLSSLNGGNIIILNISINDTYGKNEVSKFEGKIDETTTLFMGVYDSTNKYYENIFTFSFFDTIANLGGLCDNTTDSPNNEKNWVGYYPGISKRNGEPIKYIGDELNYYQGRNADLIFINNKDKFPPNFEIGNSQKIFKTGFYILLNISIILLVSIIIMFLLFIYKFNYRKIPSINEMK